MSRLPATYRPVDIVEKKSEFALRTVIIYSEGFTATAEMKLSPGASDGASAPSGKVAREQGKYKEIKQYWADRGNAKTRRGFAGQGRGARRCSALLGRRQHRRRTAAGVKGPLSVGEMMAWEHARRRRRRSPFF